MNLIAHIFLSQDNPDWIIGNMVADFIRGKEKYNFSKEIIQGIDLHRFIDFFTDHHSVVRESVEILKPTHKKYSPVISDIIYDYLLINNWKLHTEEPLEDFAKKSYDTLLSYEEVLPDNLAKMLPALIDENWIIRTGDIDYLEKTMVRMDRRTRFPSDFKSSIKVLEDNMDAFNKQFNSFFPELMESVKDYSEYV